MLVPRGCRLPSHFRSVSILATSLASQLQIRINAGDKAALVAAADRAGLSLSASAKKVLLRAAKRQRK